MKRLLRWLRVTRFRLVTSAVELTSASLEQPLIGVFSEETLAVRWQGTDGRTAEATETGWLHYLSDYLGDTKEPDVMDCEPNPEYGDTPSLAIMTETALEHLSTDNDQGFFLMIESASIDKQSHKRDPCGSIGEIEQLEEALDHAQTFAQQASRYADHCDGRSRPSSSNTPRAHSCTAATPFLFILRA